MLTNLCRLGQKIKIEPRNGSPFGLEKSHRTCGQTSADRKVQSVTEPEPSFSGSTVPVPRSNGQLLKWDGFDCAKAEKSKLNPVDGRFCSIQTFNLNACDLFFFIMWDIYSVLFVRSSLQLNDLTSQYRLQLFQIWNTNSAQYLKY